MSDPLNRQLHKSKRLLKIIKIFLVIDVAFLLLDLFLQQYGLALVISMVAGLTYYSYRSLKETVEELESMRVIDEK